MSASTAFHLLPRPMRLKALRMASKPVLTEWLRSAELLAVIAAAKGEGIPASAATWIADLKTAISVEVQA